jgi:hypothetical protein
MKLGKAKRYDRAPYSKENQPLTSQKVASLLSSPNTKAYYQLFSAFDG